MAEIAPNDDYNALDVSDDDDYSDIEDLLFLGLLKEASESLENKRKLCFPSIFIQRTIINPGGLIAIEDYTRQLLTGYDRRFYDELCIIKKEFYQLSEWISSNIYMKGLSRYSLQLKLMIFLYIIG